MLNNKNKKIIWMTWKDLKHPEAGGAESVNEESAKRLVKNGYQVIFLVGAFAGCQKEEIIDGYKVIRMGSRYTVHLRAMIYYLRNLRGWADLVIDEINAAPFFARFYSGKPTILLVHQLAREIWFYQMPIWLGWIGWLAEPIYLWILRKSRVITISKSSRQDLMQYGFKKENIDIISLGIRLEPLNNLESIDKYYKPTILSLGAIREMKRTLHQIKAFEIAKKKIPDLQLKVAGSIDGKYGEKVLDYIKKSKFKADIEIFGKVTSSKKIELMQKSQLIVVTSLKEGWGLIVTEANSQGTPAVVYNVDGLKDSVKNEQTGLIANKNTPEFLAEKIVELLRDYKKYDRIKKIAWQWSKKNTFERSYQDFIKIIKSHDDRK